MSSSTIPTGPGPVIIPLSAVFQNDVNALLSADTTGSPSAFDTAFDATFADAVHAQLDVRNMVS